LKRKTIISYLPFLVLIVAASGYFIYSKFLSKPAVNVRTEIITQPPKGEFQAKIVRIIDGDTVEALFEKQTLKIRLAYIDCPEKRGRQPFGNSARKAVSELCFGQNITVEWSGEKDRYGRYIAVLWNEKGKNVNKEMVKRGMAWHFKKYSNDNSYDLLERLARKNKTGLWADPNPIPPWEWRKPKSSVNP